MALRETTLEKAALLALGYPEAVLSWIGWMGAYRAC